MVEMTAAMVVAARVAIAKRRGVAESAAWAYGEDAEAAILAVAPLIEAQARDDLTMLIDAVDNYFTVLGRCDGLELYRQQRLRQTLDAVRPALSPRPVSERETT